MKKLYNNHRFTIWCILMMGMMLTVKFCEDYQEEEYSKPLYKPDENCEIKGPIQL